MEASIVDTPGDVEETLARYETSSSPDVPTVDPSIQRGARCETPYSLL